MSSQRIAGAGWDGMARPFSSAGAFPQRKTGSSIWHHWRQVVYAPPERRELRVIDLGDFHL